MDRSRVLTSFLLPLQYKDQIEIDVSPENKKEQKIVRMVIGNNKGQL
jgi:hypothetical protein